MLLAGAWFGHQNLSHQGGEGASAVYRSHRERCQSDLTLAREEGVITERNRLCFCLRGEHGFDLWIGKIPHALGSGPQLHMP